MKAKMAKPGRHLAAMAAVLVALAAVGLGLAGFRDSEPPRFALPVAHSNNAVALADGPDGATLYSFNGLQAGKTWRDTSHAAFACVIKERRCTEIAPLPVAEGRLASTAVTVGGTIYIFGGYSVAEDGTEVSTPELFAFDPRTQAYRALAPMPTPVDDAVALPWRDRYIYLVSGWHNDDNVSLVQLYDTHTNRWHAATPFPGQPVFGHAGGIVGDTMLIADGVGVTGMADGKRRFGAVHQALRGDIDPANPAVIAWRPVAPHPHPPLYRMAASGDAQSGLIVFAGGSDNPYNYDGIGYNGTASSASDRIFGYDPARGEWRDLGKLALPSMDHRSLLVSGDDFYLVGGMDGQQRVLSVIGQFRLGSGQLEPRSADPNSKMDKEQAR